MDIIAKDAFVFPIDLYLKSFIDQDQHYILDKQPEQFSSSEIHFLKNLINSQEFLIEDIFNLFGKINQKIPVYFACQNLSIFKLLFKENNKIKQFIENIIFESDLLQLRDFLQSHFLVLNPLFFQKKDFNCKKQIQHELEKILNTVQFQNKFILKLQQKIDITKDFIHIEHGFEQVEQAIELQLIHPIQDFSLEAILVIGHQKNHLIVLNKSILSEQKQLIYEIVQFFSVKFNSINFHYFKQLGLYFDPQVYMVESSSMNQMLKMSDRQSSFTNQIENFSEDIYPLQLLLNQLTVHQSTFNIQNISQSTPKTFEIDLFFKSQKFDILSSFKKIIKKKGFKIKDLAKQSNGDHIDAQFKVFIGPIYAQNKFVFNFYDLGQVESMQHYRLAQFLEQNPKEIKRIQNLYNRINNFDYLGPQLAPGPVPIIFSGPVLDGPQTRM